MRGTYTTVKRDWSNTRIDSIGCSRILNSLGPGRSKNLGRNRARNFGSRKGVCGADSPHSTTVYASAYERDGTAEEDSTPTLHYHSTSFLFCPSARARAKKTGHGPSTVNMKHGKTAPSVTRASGRTGTHGSWEMHPVDGTRIRRRNRWFGILRAIRSTARP